MHGTDVAHFQRELNVRLARWGVRKRIAESGVYDAQTRLAAHQVAYGLGIETAAFKQGITPAVRELDPCPEPPHARPDRPRPHAARVARSRCASASPTPRRRPKAGAVAPRRRRTTPRRTTARRTTAPSHKVAAHTDAGPGRCHPRGRRPLRGHHHRRGAALQGARLARVRGHGGRVVVHQRVRARRRGQPDQERPRAPNLVVTEALYKTYLQHRNRGEGSQGVGPMQLTSAFLQDRADQLGGCFKPGPNIRVGVEYLASLIAKFGGVHGGLEGLQRLERLRRPRDGSRSASGTTASRGMPPRRRRTATAAMPVTATPAHSPGRPRTPPHDRAQAHGGVRRQGLSAPAQPPLRRVGDRRAGRRGRRLRHRDPPRRPPGRPRPGPRARRVRQGHDAGGARADAHAEPAHARAAQARRVTPRLGGKAAQEHEGREGRQQGAKGAKVASGRYPLAVRGTFLGRPGRGHAQLHRARPTTGSPTTPSTSGCRSAPR